MVQAMMYACIQEQKIWTALLGLCAAQLAGERELRLVVHFRLQYAATINILWPLPWPWPWPWPSRSRSRSQTIYFRNISRRWQWPWPWPCPWPWPWPWPWLWPWPCMSYVHVSNKLYVCMCRIWSNFHPATLNVFHHNYLLVHLAC